MRVYGVPVGTFQDSDGSNDEGGSVSENDGEDDGQGDDSDGKVFREYLRIVRRGLAR